MSFWDRFTGKGSSVTNKMAEELVEEVVEKATERIKEDGWVPYDPDLYLSAQQGGSLFFNRLSQGQRELNPVLQERALELAYLLYESNPLAKAIMETKRDFILGDSLSVHSGDTDESRRDEQQQVIDRFWSDHVNQMDIKFPQKVLELGMFGELCITVEVNPVNGHVRLGMIDPGSIRRIFVDPRNIEIPLAVVTLFRSEKQLSEEKWYRIIQPNEVIGDKWYGRLTAKPTPKHGEDAEADRIEWWDSEGNHHTHEVAGSCFYFPVNKVSNASRGRSDMLSLVDWVDAFDQLLFGELDRGLLMKAFIWDVTLTGYNDKQITDYQAANPQPRPASVRYHNEKVAWNAVTPDLKSADTQAAAELILSYIATGARLPKAWINGTSGMNRAMAQEMTAPSLAHLSERQRYVTYIIKEMMTFVLDQAEMKGVIKRRKKMKGTQQPEPWVITATLPDLKQMSQIVTAQAMNNLVMALNQAVMSNFIDVELGREVVVMFVRQMGVDVNLEALKERIGNKPTAQLQVLQGRTPANDKVAAGDSNSGAKPSGSGQPMAPSNTEMLKNLSRMSGDASSSA